MNPMHTIVCLSSQSWDDAMWTNKQHVMSRLARDHRVVHVDYGLRPLPMYLWRRLRHDRRSPATLVRALTDGVTPRGGTLYVGDHASPLIAGAFPHGHPVRDWSTFDLQLKFLQRWLDRTVPDEDPIAWVYHPGYGDAVAKMRKKLLVYDCVDDYPSFPTYRDNPDWIRLREERLCRCADLVFCTSRALYERRRGYNPENTYLVHNVGDAEHFNAALDEELPIPPELAELRERGPVIGFVGAISDYKLDLELVLEVARARPDWQIALIGPVGMADPGTDVAAAQEAPNVHLLGYRAYADLPAYIKGFDVATIPYRISHHTEAVFPIKFFEFLATGKPVVITPLPALEDYWGKVEVASSADAFVEACAKALAEDGDEARDARLALAAQNSWPKRIGEMMRLIGERL